MVFEGFKLPLIRVNGPSALASPPVEPERQIHMSNHRGACMDYERWVCQNLDLLKMRSMTSDRMLTGVQLPPRLADKIFKVDVDERNGKGETLMIGVVLYIIDELKQAKFLNLLLRLGADPNLGDIKNHRTPIMFACLHKKVAAVRVLVNHTQTNLSLRDRLGNTALMYAALQGEQVIIDLLSVRLAKSWSFDTFLNKNRNGKTAETMAMWSGKMKCANILQSARLRMLQRMHKQLALIHCSAQLRGWKGYSEAYYAVRLWRSKIRRRRHSISVPDLVDVEDGDSHKDGHRPRSITGNDFLRVISDRKRAQSC